MRSQSVVRIIGHGIHRHGQEGGYLGRPVVGVELAGGGHRGEREVVMDHPCAAIEIIVIERQHQFVAVDAGHWSRLILTEIPGFEQCRVIKPALFVHLMQVIVGVRNGERPVTRDVKLRDLLEMAVGSATLVAQGGIPGEQHARCQRLQQKTTFCDSFLGRNVEVACFDSSPRARFECSFRCDRSDVVLVLYRTSTLRSTKNGNLLISEKVFLGGAGGIVFYVAPVFQFLPLSIPTPIASTRCSARVIFKRLLLGR